MEDSTSRCCLRTQQRLSCAKLNSDETMCSYWLYILKHELHAEGCTLALSVFPTERDECRSLQTVSYKSWHQLSDALSQAGVDREALRRTKVAVDSEGLDTLRDISLSPAQLHVLGFKA